jgi:ribosomal protein S18 acetylase RimI-like enzyme
VRYRGDVPNVESEMCVRVAQSSDLPWLLDAMVDFNRLEGIVWSPDVGREAVVRLLGDPSLGVVGIAHEADAPIGYFVVTWGYDLEWNGRDAFLTEIYLSAAARGAGRGRMLLAEAERIARESGARALHLMVRDENAVARRLYAGAGYTSPPRIFLTKTLG